MTDRSPPRRDLALAQLPPDVAELVRASDWWRATTAVDQSDVAAAMVKADAPGAGWIAGWTLFVEPSPKVVYHLLGRHRAGAMPDALSAAAIAIELEWPWPPRLWRNLAQLVLRTPEVPARFVATLAAGCGAADPDERAAAAAIAVVVGARAVVAAAVDRADGETRARLVAAVAAIDAAAPAPHVHEPLLARLLDAWATTRDPALEPWIALAGAESARLRGALDRASQTTWLGVAGAGDPADTDRLVDAVYATAVPAALARVEALGRRAVHPRLAALARLAALGPPWRGTRVQLAIAQVLERAALPVTREAIAGVVAAHTPTLGHDDRRVTREGSDEIAAAYQRALVAIDRQPAPRAADPALLAEACRALAPLVERARLFDEVAANPGDLAVRAVLADHLADDPRGEFIALQLAEGRGDPAIEERAAQLFADHGDRWTPLPVEQAGLRFERGFVVTVRSKADEIALRYAADRGAWATVETLEVAAERIDFLVARMPRLRVLLATPAALDRLERSGPHRGIRVLATREPWLPRSRDAFPDLAVVAGRLALDDLAHTRALGLSAVVLTHARPSIAEVLARRAEGPAILRMGGGDGSLLDAAALALEVAGARAHVSTYDALFHVMGRAVCTELARVGVEDILIQVRDVLVERGAIADRLAAIAHELGVAITETDREVDLLACPATVEARW